MKLANVLNLIIKILETSNISNATKESKLLLSDVLKINEYEIITNTQKNINEKELKKIISLVEKRAKKMPYAYIFNERYFFDMKFFVDENVLIPRRESEHIIENILHKINKKKSLNILDLGIGSGALLITLLNHLPNACGVGIDISFKALMVAKKNINKYKLNNRCFLIHSNWATAIKSNYFDIIICNPPYIDEKYINNLDEEVKNYEPIIALNGGKEGLQVLSNLLPSVHNCLKTNGSAYFEIGYDQSDKAQNILKNKKFIIKNIIKDLSNYERIIEVKI